jgi:hypothetical protein
VWVSSIFKNKICAEGRGKKALCGGHPIISTRFGSLIEVMRENILIPRKVFKEF